MLNVRKALLKSSSLLVFLGLGIMLIGRYWLDAGFTRQRLLSSGQALIWTAIVLLIVSVRRGRNGCALECGEKL